MKKIYIIHENNEWTAPLMKHPDDILTLRGLAS